MASSGEDQVFTAVRAVIRQARPFWGPVIVITIVYWLFGATGFLSWLAPIAFAAGLWLVRASMFERSDFRALLALKHGDLPQQGAWTAVGGKAVSLEPDPVVEIHNVLAYRFRIVTGSRKGAPRVRQGLMPLRCDAFFLAPTGIDTSNSTVMLAGFPDLTSSGKRGLPNDLLVEAKAKSEHSPRLLPPVVVREIILSSVYDRIDMVVQYDAYGLDEGGEMESYMLRPGEEVCVFGIWDKGTLRRSINRPGGMPVYRGSVGDVLEKLEGDTKAVAIFGGVLIAAAAGLAIWSLI